MYIIKHALRCIGRSKGRNILIGIIALVIATSACIGLSIRQAAESTKASALEGMSVTATIQYDRAGAMGSMGGGRPGMNGSGFPGGGGFDPSQMADMMNGNYLTALDLTRMKQIDACLSFREDSSKELQSQEHFPMILILFLRMSLQEILIAKHKMKLWKFSVLLLIQASVLFL